MVNGVKKTWGTGSEQTGGKKKKGTGMDLGTFSSNAVSWSPITQQKTA